MSEPTIDGSVEEIGKLLQQGRIEEAMVLAEPLKKRILELLREGKSAEADKLLPPIMLLPPDRAFLTEYGTLTAVQMSEEKAGRWWQFWK